MNCTDHKHDSPFPQRPFEGGIEQCVHPGRGVNCQGKGYSLFDNYLVNKDVITYFVQKYTINQWNLTTQFFH